MLQYNCNFVTNLKTPNLLKMSNFFHAVIAGRNLISMDVGGKSDPYCVITVGEEEAKTDVQYNTVNPEWNASFSFSLYNGPHFQSTG